MGDPFSKIRPLFENPASVNTWDRPEWPLINFATLTTCSASVNAKTCRSLGVSKNSTSTKSAELTACTLFDGVLVEHPPHRLQNAAKIPISFFILRSVRRRPNVE